MTTTLGVIADVLGIVYVAAWALSNYPQLYRNQSRKSVEGYSLNFQLWNITGFTFLLVYTTVGYWYQHQPQHHLKHTILPNDIAFSAHSFVINVVMSIQCLMWAHKGTQSLSRVHVTMIICLWTLALYNVTLSLGGFLPWFSSKQTAYAFSTVQFLGFGKSFVSFVKYVPQVYLNYQRKSTEGWSILNTLLDLTGGICSFAQMLVIAYDSPLPDGSPDFSHITGNIPKVVLAVESVMFDLILMTQHYILYNPNSKKRAGAGAGAGFTDEAFLLSDDGDVIGGAGAGAGAAVPLYSDESTDKLAMRGARGAGAAGMSVRGGGSGSSSSINALSTRHAGNRDAFLVYDST